MLHGNPASNNPSDEDKWLSLSQASKILGVNQATLRNWADAGEIRTFRTPGGHRRFAADDIRTLIEAHSHKPGHAATASLGQMTIDKIRRKLRHVKSPHDTWYHQFDEQGRMRLRESGRRLVSLIGDYIAKGRGKTQALQEVRRLGQEYGLEFARCGLPLNEAMEAFAFFHTSMNDMAKDMVKGSTPPDQALELWRHVSELLDELLIAITESYIRAEKPVAHEAGPGSNPGMSYI